VTQAAPDPAIRRLMLFFAVVYTVEGIGQAKVGIVWQPLTWFLKQTLGWTPLQVAASLAVLDVPWMVKPLYGAVSDFLPLFGYRRRSYLLLANLAAVAAFLAVVRTTAPAAIVPALLLTSIAMAISSTLCGALLVEHGQRFGRSGAFVNQQWLWFNVALMAATLVGGGLVQWLPAATALHAAALIAAAAPLAVLAGLALVPEARAPLDPAALRRRFAAFVAAFRSRTLWLIAGFLFCYYFSPGFGTPLYFHMTDRLGFSQAFIGALASVGAAGWIAGGLLYRWALARLSTHALLVVSVLCGPPARWPISAWWTRSAQWRCISPAAWPG
jgi:MFS family permease